MVTFSLEWPSRAAAVGLAVLLLLGSGSLTAGLTRPDQSALTGSRPGILALIQVSGFALAAIAGGLKRHGWMWLPLGAVIGVEAMRAHPHLADPLLGPPLTLVHLAAATLWAGMLVHALRTLISWRYRRDLARQALGAYSRPAVWLFTAVVLSGLGSALMLVRPDSLVTTDYGRVLLAKTVLVAAVAGLALAGRRLLHRKSALDSAPYLTMVEGIKIAAQSFTTDVSRLSCCAP